MTHVPAGIQVIGKTSELVLSKKSRPGDGSFARGRKGGGISPILR